MQTEQHMPVTQDLNQFLTFMNNLWRTKFVKKEVNFGQNKPLPLDHTDT